MEHYKSVHKARLGACLCCLRLVAETIVDEGLRRRAIDALGPESVTVGFPTDAQIEPLLELYDDTGDFDYMAKVFVNALATEMFPDVIGNGGKHRPGGVAVKDAREMSVALYAMDYIMHCLNNEEAMGWWLMDGVPDDAIGREELPTAEQCRLAADADLSDEEFDRRLEGFVRAISAATYPDAKIDGMLAERKVLW